ncbi:hypothetical protein QEN19_003596 [Hanseniaspora menglaensis]
MLFLNQNQEKHPEDIYFSPSQLFPQMKALWEDMDPAGSEGHQFTVSRATSPIFITKKWNIEDDFGKKSSTSSGRSTVFDTMSVLDNLMETDFNIPMSIDLIDNVINDESNTVSHTPNMRSNLYETTADLGLFSPKPNTEFMLSAVKKTSSYNENSITPIATNSRTVNNSLWSEYESRDAAPAEQISNAEILDIAGTTITVQKVYNNKGKSISDSRLSTESLRQTFQLPSVKAATRLEAHVEKLLTENCNFQLGYKTWVRDTQKDEREQILDVLEEKLNEDVDFLISITGRTRKLEKRSIETIVRKCTYAKQQSRLRKERRKAADKSGNPHSRKWASEKNVFSVNDSSSIYLPKRYRINLKSYLFGLTTISFWTIKHTFTVSLRFF